MMQKDNKQLPNSDRTWPLPGHSHIMRMNWLDLLFAHWPIEPDVIQRHLPDPLRVDVWDGMAWIAIVPFRMTDVAPRFVPAVPGMSAFPELNVRTYVTVDDKPGVWFFSLDATNRIAVRLARWAFRLPYMDATMSIVRDEDWYRYRSKRTHRNERTAEFHASYRPSGDLFFAKPGSLEHWLTARYCLYAANPQGEVFRGEIDHPPWPLQPAELATESNTVLDVFGVDTNCPPHLLFSQGTSVRAWMNQRIR